MMLTRKNLYHIDLEFPKASVMVNELIYMAADSFKKAIDMAEEYHPECKITSITQVGWVLHE